MCTDLQLWMGKLNPLTIRVLTRISAHHLLSWTRDWVKVRGRGGRQGHLNPGQTYSVFAILVSRRTPRIPVIPVAFCIISVQYWVSKFDLRMIFGDFIKKGILDVWQWSEFYENHKEIEGGEVRGARNHHSQLKNTCFLWLSWPQSVELLQTL